jgi:exodeoxyribonuclease V alpha subunit
MVMRPVDLERNWLIANLIEVLVRRSYALAPSMKDRIEAIIRGQKLTYEQGQAVRSVALNGLTLLTGGPGTGKTHTLRAVLSAAEALGLAVSVLAPTGKAAARATELTGRPASTVHRMLRGAPGSMREQGPLREGVIVLEEASMVDAEVMAWLAKNIRPDSGMRMLIVGDENQLPSVGRGRVLSDLLATGVVATVRLTVVQRQSGDSRIVTQAHRLLAGDALLPEETHDWTPVALPSSVDAAQRHVMRVLRRVLREEASSLLRSTPFDPRRDLQVLTPRVGGPLGVRELNTLLRAELNPQGEDGPWIAEGQRVRVGDRVACIANDYTVKPDGLMNGEQGMVVVLEGDAISLRLDDGRTVRTRGVQNANLTLAFAATVHRAQGAEFPVVIFVYHGSHAPLLDQRILYTAITRARQRVVLCADATALQRSAASATRIARFSALAGQITGVVRSRGEKMVERQ